MMNHVDKMKMTPNDRLEYYTFVVVVVIDDLSMPTFACEFLIRNYELWLLSFYFSRRFIVIFLGFFSSPIVLLLLMLSWLVLVAINASALLSLCATKNFFNLPVVHKSWLD